MSPGPRRSPARPGLMAARAWLAARWRAFDTLFLRLFLLMWVALVASTQLGFNAFRVTADAGTAGGPGHGGPHLRRDAEPPGPPDDGTHGPSTAHLLLPSLPPPLSVIEAHAPHGPPTDGGPQGGAPDSAAAMGPQGRPGGDPGHDTAGPAVVTPATAPGTSPATLDTRDRAVPPPPASVAPFPPQGPAGHRLAQDERILWSLWLDYLVRVLVIGLAAWWGARWLSRPMRALGAAAQGLQQALQPGPEGGLGSTPPCLDETQGTREVRDTAAVFNRMTHQIKRDLDAQRLLLATVSHDLRTPLARLRLRLAALDDAQAAPAVADVREMDALIESLLDLFRPAPASAGPAPRIEAFALVQALVDDLPGGGEDVLVRPRPDGQPSLVRCPPAALRRMAQNLIDNARRHSAEVEVALSLKPPGGPEDGGAPGPRLLIQVLDRGPGLSPEQLARVGMPFVRGLAGSVPAHAPARGAQAPGPGDDVLEAARHAALQDTGRAGLGLGLHITRALAERAGGRLHLGPREGGGLVATLDLPAG